MAFSDSFRLRALGVTLVALLLAGCGGGGSSRSSLPSVVPDTTTRQPRSVSSTPALYVASSNAVYAYDLTANNSDAPLRTITTAGKTNVAIATFTDGTLDILQSVTGPLAPCRVAVESSTANGNAVALSAVACSSDSLTPSGIATNQLNGGIEILGYDTTTSQYVVNRMTQSNDGVGTLGAGTSLNLGASPSGVGGIATDKAHDYIDTTNGNVTKYKHDTSGNQGYTDFFRTGTGSSGPIAASKVDSTVYIVEPGVASSGKIRIAGFLPGTITMSQNPTADFTFDLTASSITAMDVDAQGNVYVGFTNAGTFHVKVFPAHLSGTPVRNLTVPAAIVGVSVYQPAQTQAP